MFRSRTVGALCSFLTALTALGVITMAFRPQSSGSGSVGKATLDHWAHEVVMSDLKPSSALPVGMVRRIKVLPDKAPDTSSLKSIVESVTRGAKTNDEKAVAIYNFAVLANYHRQYPQENGGVEALKLYNVYGWSLCGGLHSALAALWREMGWEWRFVGWSNPGHTTVEVKYDGKWHYLDTFLKFYVWKQDPNAPGGRTIASQDDIKHEPSLVTSVVFDPGRKVYYQKNNQFEIVNDRANWLAPAFLVCGDEPSGVLTGIQSSHEAGSPTEWEGIKFDGPYTTDVNLGPGYALALNWSAQPDAHWWNGPKEIPGHTCGDKDYRNSPVLGPILEPYAPVGGATRTYANGTLTFSPDFSDPAFVSSLAGRENLKWANGKLTPMRAGQPASITVRLQSPYVMTRASGLAAGADQAELSTDGGKTWKAIQLKDFSDAVGGQYNVLVKFTFKTALTSLKLEAVVQHNRAIAPYLSPGRNTVTVSADGAKALGDNRLVVTYVYETGSRSMSYEQMAERSAEVGRAHYASWSQTPTVVQKTFTAQDLPATFTIDVPTPKGKHPVYPRMLYVRREIIGPNSKPAPLPAGAVAPAARPDDTLQELPSPFLIGLARPPIKIARRTATRKFLLQAGTIVSMTGEAAGPDQILRWQKDNSQAWVMLVGGDLKDLPKPRDIEAARLVLPVLSAHEKAPTRVGVEAHNQPFAPGQAYNFKNFGEMVGTAVIDRQPAGMAEYAPPKEFKIDITRDIKNIAAGETMFRGYGIRIVPDRSVDDGWTVKLRMPKDPQIVLELDVYTDTPKH